jgi:S-methylmethionine-dependent homocysteine/selenocysteine methylase
MGRAVRLVRFAALMALQYAVVVANMRAVAAGSYGWTVSTDALIAFNGIVLTKFVVGANTWPEKAAVVVGGCCGSVVTLWLTKGRL